MQTTLHARPVNHVERLKGETSSDDTGSSSSAGPAPAAPIDGETLQALNTLIGDEANLRLTADHLDREASTLEHDHDEASMHAAAKLHADAGTMLGVAHELARIISEAKADPHKKISTRKIEYWRTSALIAIGHGDHEAELAQTVHHDAVEHQSMAQHTLETKLAAPKPATPHLVCKKPTVGSPAKAKGGAPVAPTAKPSAEEPEEHPGMVARIAARASHAMYRVGSAIQQGAEHVAHFGGKVISAVVHAGPLVAMSNAGSMMLHAVMHPIRTVKKMMHWLGGDEDEAPAAGAATVPKQSHPMAVSQAVQAAVHGLSLPSFPMAGVVADWFTPNIMPGIGRAVAQGVT